MRLLSRRSVQSLQKSNSCLRSVRLVWARAKRRELHAAMQSDLKEFTSWIGTALDCDVGQDSPFHWSDRQVSAEHQAGTAARHPQPAGSPDLQPAIRLPGASGRLAIPVRLAQGLRGEHRGLEHRFENRYSALIGVGEGRLEPRVDRQHLFTERETPSRSGTMAVISAGCVASLSL